jgi:hypothetical protein
MARRLLSAADVSVRTWRPLVCLPVSACFAWLALVAIAAGWAETIARLDSPDGLELAAALELRFLPAGPNPSRLERLSELRPASRRAALERALQAQPRLTSARIALGLELERAGQLAAAERALLEAAHFDRQYLPAWTLANHYFRRGQSGQFWRWAARAAARTYDDFRPLIRLADRLEPDPVAALGHLGSTPRLERAYLDFLIGQGSLDRAEAVAARMLARHDPPDQPFLATLVTHQIRAGRATQALALWNALFIPLDPRRGPVLTNGDLRAEPSGAGFDWSVSQARGLSFFWSPRLATFELSGAQPDAVPALEQALPVATAKRYVLRLEYRFPAPNPRASFPYWELNGEPVLELKPSDSWRESAGAYSSPVSGLAPLKLVFLRRPGTVPLRGRIAIRNIRVEVL